MKLELGNWVYEINHDDETGSLEVVSVTRRSTIEAVKNYLKAEASMVLGGKVPLEVLDQRKAACDGCESANKKAEGEWYCKSCGCPEWERSKLQVKWEMPGATCPLRKWPKVG